MLMNTSGLQHDELFSGLKQKVEDIEVLQQRLARNKAQLLPVFKGIERESEGIACADNARMLINHLRGKGVGDRP